MDVFSRNGQAADDMTAKAGQVRPVIQARATRLFKIKLSIIVKLLLPFAIAAAVIGSLDITIRWSTAQSDAASLARQTQLIRLILSKMEASVARDQESVTIWDDAVNAVSGTKDAEWLKSNLGEWMHTYFQHDGAFVVDEALTPVYFFLDDVEDAAIASGRLQDAALPLLIKLQSRLKASDTTGLNDQTLSIGESDIVAVDGRPAIISVKPIISDSGKIEQVAGDEFLHIAVRYLDGKFLESIGREYQFEDLRFSWNVRSDALRSYETLTARSGKTVGYLSWVPFKPSAGVIEATTPTLYAAAVIVFGIISALGGVLWTRSSRLRLSEDSLSHMAHHDHLTGLPNRATFATRLAGMLVRSEKTQTNAVLYLDLDRFKQVNDTLGHPVGDQLIVQVAARLKEVAGPASTVARIGGDEFTAIVEDTSQNQIEQLCDAMIATIHRPFTIDGQSIRIGLSIGVCLSSGDAFDADELIRKADIALYHAKSAGRGRYAIFGAHMDELMQNRRELERDLRQAIESKQQLHVLYQPVFSSVEDKMTGVEALVRWAHPYKGMILPDVFIPLAEELGLIEQIGEFVLTEACRTALRIGHLEVAVNASAVELRNESYALRVLSTLNKLGFDPKRLEIEITESSLMGTDGACEKNIEALRKIGVRFALDDFGTGFSSFGRLQRLDIDRIKIDRCFVSGFGKPGGDEAIVQAIITLARAKGLSTTAEGIETQDQQATLRAFGCDALQGYLLSQPISGEELSELVRLSDQEVALEN